MDLTSSSAEADDRLGAKPIVTIGNFDGVHLGHRALLERAAALGAPSGAPVLALTFDPTPAEVLGRGAIAPRIESTHLRVERLLAAGAARVVVEPFTREFAAQPAAWFASEVLGQRLRAAGVVIGWDFRFGAGRAGDAALLQRALGVPVAQVSAVLIGDEPVSSTRVRAAIASGQAALAATLLGRPHELVGEVVHGDHRGRSLGYPTANVRVQGSMLPADGVYAVELVVGDTSWPGMANIGVRPTFGAGRSVEVHAFGLHDELYGAAVRVRLVQWLRAERTFAGPAELVAQLAQDASAALLALSQA